MKKALLFSLLVNFLLSLVKLLGSLISNSKTLMADSIHCLSDMSTDIISLIGAKLSEKKPDEEHPFGHGKLEYLTSIIISFFIISLGITILINSFKGELKQTNYYALIVLAISIVLKFILSSYLIRKSKRINSNILYTNGMESRYDVINSSFALIFIILSLLGYKNKIFMYADIIGSILMSVLTLKIGIQILIKNIKSIIGEIDRTPEKMQQIKEILLHNKEIFKIRRITLLKYGSYLNATIELILDESMTLKELYKIEKRIKEELKTSNLNIRYVTVNMKPKKSNK